MTALTDQVDALFAAWDRPDTPGCALGVIQDGRLVYARGYGLANLDYDLPITPDSVFYIASTSKQFVTASILLLAQSGKISLEDDVRTYVPELPQYDASITIRHLVHHTSGLRDYLTLMELAGKSHEDYFDLGDAIELLARQKALNFPPGEQFLYCNSGYALLAEIVKRASGQSLREFAQAQIFHPLGMHDTHFDDDRKMVVKNRVVSYGPRAGNGFQRYLKNFDAVGSGGLLTTVKDLYLWDQNFYHHQVGGGDLVSHLLTRGRLNDGKTLAYAAGLEHGAYRGLETVSHAGEMLGFRTQLLRFPTQRFSVICLANLETINPTGLARQVADIYLADAFTQEKAAELKTIRLSENELSAFAGLYRNVSSGLFVELLVDKGHLIAQGFGLTVPLAPVSATRFRSSDVSVDLEITFEQQARDAPPIMRVGLPDEEPAAFQPAEVVSLTTDELAAYAGDYYGDALQVTYKLVLKDGKLYCRYRNAPQDPLRAGPRDVLWLPQATLEFVRDDQGTLSGLTLSADGARNIRFVRK